MNTIIFAVFIPFLAAIIIPFIHKNTKIHSGWFVLLVPSALFLLLIQYIGPISAGNTYSYSLDWIPTFDISLNFYLDGLSLIFALLITGIGALVALYSIYYLSKNELLAHFYIYLLLFMGSMLGVVFSDHLIGLYTFWELTSISSFLLIAFWFHRKGSRYGAQKSLLITITGGMAMLAGLLMLQHIYSTFSIREMIQSFSDGVDHSLFIPAMILILIGAFAKSAQFPFHIWLPDAMEAPTPVSAYLHSATMVKAGIYLVARFTPLFAGNQTWFWLVTSVGLITLFWAAFTAIRQTDLKALLAYSTVSQLGLIMSLIGVGSIALYTGTDANLVIYTQAVFAALFHLINHATFKGALFMVIGIVDYQVGTRDIRRLGGLIALMPVSFTIALIGSFSMAGLPPFNGFLSKEMFFTAMLQLKNLEVFSIDSVASLFPVIAWIASIFTFIYSMIIVFKTFFGPLDKKSLGHIQEPKPGMLISPLILGLFVITIFFFPNVIGEYLITPAMASVYPFDAFAQHLSYDIKLWHGFNTELLMTMGIIIVGSLLYASFGSWKRIYRLFPEKYSLDALYNGTLERIESFSESVTRSYMTDSMQDYIRYIMAFFILVTGGYFLYAGAFSYDASEDAAMNPFVWLIVLIMFAAALAILFATSRLSAIVFNGVIGFSIATLFVVFRAPDLALTQLVIETVTTALFLLSFYFLPKWSKQMKKVEINWTNLLIAISVGITFTLVTLSVHSERLFTSISSYFENAYDLVGGRNIVNAILGDFRAFDTMLEIIVLFISGIGVYAIIKSGEKKGGKKHEN